MTAQTDNQATATATRSPRPVRLGVVTSAARDKTIKVTVEYLVRHPKYGKLMRRRTVLHAHDEKNDCIKGDRVEVMLCRPISKTKSWRLSRIVEKAPGERGGQA